MNKQGEGKIEYLTHTWSPVTGCLHGCSYCYMQRMAKRFPQQISMEPKYHVKRIAEPFEMKKPARIGVSFSGDLFGDWVDSGWIYSVLNVIRQCPQHRFLLLTKNPKRYGKFVIPENCWCGTSTTGNGEGQKRVETLDKLYDSWRFISLEPWRGGLPVAISPTVGWLIIGGETGKGKAHPPKQDIDDLLKSWRLLTDAPVFIKSNAGYPKKIQEYPDDLILPWERT